MPYDTRSRTSGHVRSGISRRNTGASTFVLGPSHYECVYSYRSAKHVNNAKPNPEDSYIPPKGGNLAETLAYRRDFTERQLTGILSKGRVAPTHFLLGDVGHEFAVSKISSRTSPSRLVYSGNAAGTDLYDLFDPQPRFIRTLDRTGAVQTTGPIQDMSGYFASLGFAPFVGGLTNLGPGNSDRVKLEASQLNAMNPFKSTASLAQGAVELLRGDVPKLFGRLVGHYNLIMRMKSDGIRDATQALGSDYLNVVFGWTPIIRDIQAAINVFADIDKALFISDDTRRNRKWVVWKRGAGTTANVTLTAAGPLQDLAADNAFGQRTVMGTPITLATDSRPFDITLSDEVSIWTTARFHTGVRPSAANNGFWDRAEDLNRVLGDDFDISFVWELTPWSWLIDWFSNVGSVLENISDLGLNHTLLNYAYSTLRREARCVMRADPWTKSVPTGIGVISHTGSTTVSTLDQKIRRVASPFGFGVSLDLLNANQWAILVALGLAQAR